MQLTVWCFLDGNRAHEKQSAALTSGLRSSYVGEVNSYDVCPSITASSILLGRASELSSFPKPDFLIGTGRRSRLPMLAARHRFGGRAVAINLPQLPFRWFDFAIVPEHDRPPPLDNIILSQGALTEPLPDRPVQPGRGLILLGGPSKHFSWDVESIGHQVGQLLLQPFNWQISDSRRTPEGTMASIAASASNVHIVDWRSCSPMWLQEEMSVAEQIWVSEDSISMIFESLQSRARVGIIRVPSRSRANKVRAAVQRLVDQGVVSDQKEEVSVRSEREPLDQYLLCARALLRRSGLPFR
ncbi:ELM1/GtrOC1 family putative glycosyltransferase [Microbulbifer epialgicus]|uniref:ELM1/GtrOC1 family putative glycosyltransferase n=1 Tax=Microbulbifer epialgicus TaxID=393907 RepID=A0ABV4P3Q0_9GAMM